MDRRFFVTGLLGVVGTTGMAAILPREAKALTSVPMGPAPQPNSVLPDLGAPADGAIEPGVTGRIRRPGRARRTG